MRRREIIFVHEYASLKVDSTDLNLQLHSPNVTLPNKGTPKRNEQIFRKTNHTFLNQIYAWQNSKCTFGFMAMAQ